MHARLWDRLEEPVFRGYCGDPAWSVTSGTPRNPGRKSYVYRKSELQTLDSLPLIAFQPLNYLDSPKIFIPDAVYLDNGTHQANVNAPSDFRIGLSQNAAGCIEAGREFQGQLEQESLEFTLHDSLSEKFNNRRLFVFLGICSERNLSDMVPESSLVVEPATTNNVTGGHEASMMLDNSSDKVDSNCPLPTEVLDIGSEDTDGHLDDSDLSHNNPNPDLEIIEEATFKVVHSHSNFILHPDDLGFYHYAPPPNKAKELYEAYEQRLLILSSSRIVLLSSRKSAQWRLLPW